MKEIIELLTEIVKVDLEDCKKNKKVPSEATLDTISILMRLTDDFVT